MPAAPELDDIGRLVGRVEVERQSHAEQARQSDRHVRVPGEIEVDLKTVGKHATPSDEEASGISRLSNTAEAYSERLSAISSFFANPMANIVIPAEKSLA